MDFRRKYFCITADLKKKDIWESLNKTNNQKPSPAHLQEARNSSGLSVTDRALKPRRHVSTLFYFIFFMRFIENMKITPHHPSVLRLMSCYIIDAIVIIKDKLYHST